ncbi:hypothetical protein C6361_19470 [Plantactinospora sp. BC1]|nr:hypothetical protein C6361_19470 [Plantactinospora sp. BC1]
MLMALRRWGEHAPLSDTTSPDLGIDALILALTDRFTVNDATPHDAVVHLRLDDDHFRLTIKNRQLLAKRAEVDDADTTTTTTTTTLQSLVFAERTVARRRTVRRPDHHRRPRHCRAPAAFFPTQQEKHAQHQARRSRHVTRQGPDRESGASVLWLVRRPATRWRQGR